MLLRLLVTPRRPALANRREQLQLGYLADRRGKPADQSAVMTTATCPGARANGTISDSLRVGTEINDSSPVDLLQPLGLRRKTQGFNQTSPILIHVARIIPHVGGLIEGLKGVETDAPGPGGHCTMNPGWGGPIRLDEKQVPWSASLEHYQELEKIVRNRRSKVHRSTSGGVLKTQPAGV